MVLNDDDNNYDEGGDDDGDDNDNDSGDDSDNDDGDDDGDDNGNHQDGLEEEAGPRVRQRLQPELWADQEHPGHSHLGYFGLYPNVDVE